MDACGSLAGNYLATLLVRNNLRCWIPCAQFWLSKEHSDLYLFAFHTLINWTSKRWVPTAFLIDGSKIESRAIEIGFGKTRVLRCTRHTTETLRVKLSHVEDALFYMEKAVFSETMIDCYQNIQQSIETCPYADLKRYILSKWTPQSSYSWSLHGRSSNPLWQEVTTTNAIESYHAMVRRCTNSRMNLKECTSKIIELIEKRFETARRVQSDDDHMVSRVAACVYPQMKSWSLPYQTLIGQEISRAEKMVAEDSWKFQWFQAGLDYTCRCKFFKTHSLPCKHLFIKDLKCRKSWISQEKWNEWINLITR